MGKLQSAICCLGQGMGLPAGLVSFPPGGTPAKQHRGLEEARATGLQTDACSAGDSTPASPSSSMHPEAREL